MDQPPHNPKALMPTTSLALYMQTQRTLYAAGLPEKIRALEAVLRQLGSGTDGPSGQEAALAVLAQAHKLAGSAAPLVFPPSAKRRQRSRNFSRTRPVSRDFPAPTIVSRWQPACRR